jgi:ferric-dicitrate binding protein FerR (iron transport regulator)
MSERAQRHADHGELVELAEGRMDAAGRELLESHLGHCERCSTTLGRLRMARGAFRIARGSEPDGIAYERVGAQIAWRVGREIEARAQSRRRRPWVLLGVTGAAALAASLGLLWMAHREHSAPHAAAPPVPAPKSVPQPAPEPVPPPQPGRAIGAVATLIEGQVELAGSPADALAPVTPDALAGMSLHAGTRLQTGDGRLALTLEAKTGVVLEPETEVALSALDDRLIEVALVRGKVTFEVETRRPDQQLRVRAGERTVSVRGTRFMVALTGSSLRVGVSHGRVELAAAGVPGVLRVDGGVVAELGAGDQPSAAHVGTLPDEERGELEMALPFVTGLASADEVLAGSSILHVSSAASAGLSLDGVYLGRRSLTARTRPGRHLIEASAAGQRSVSRWVDVGTGPTQVHVPIGPVAAKTPPAVAPEARPAAIDKLVRQASKEIRRCYDEGLSRKPELEGSALLRFDIDADGRLAPVELQSSTLNDATVERCLTGVVQKWRFPPGDRGTVIYPIELRRPTR